MSVESRVLIGTGTTPGLERAPERDRKLDLIQRNHGDPLFSTHAAFDQGRPQNAPLWSASSP